MGLGSMIVLFPPSRGNGRAIARLGFVEDGEMTVDGERFVRYRLVNPTG